MQALPWRIVFKSVNYHGSAVPDNAIDLLAQFLRFIPHDRLDPFDALVHPYFDELRDGSLRFVETVVFVTCGVMIIGVCACTALQFTRRWSIASIV